MICHGEYVLLAYKEPGRLSNMPARGCRGLNGAGVRDSCR